MNTFGWVITYFLQLYCYALTLFGAITLFKSLSENSVLLLLGGVFLITTGVGSQFALWDACFEDS